VRSLSLHPGHEDWVYWQYHNMGRVDGIEGDVDLNVLQGGLSRLPELSQRVADTSSAGNPLSR
jgi:lysozyme